MSKVVIVKKPRKRTHRPVAPRRAAYTGYGDYKKRTPRRARAPRAAPASSSASIGSTIGGHIGSFLGNGIQQVIKSLTGFGDYEISCNSFMPDKLSGDPPVIMNSPHNAGHIVRHREYIGDVYASTAFALTSYPINPGLIGTFPWLSQSADSYEQYKMRGLVFEFKSMSSDAVLSTASSSALGTVIFSTQYNALDTPFTDKRTMENYEFATSCKPSVSMLHPVECKASQTANVDYYIRNAPASGDQRLYDLGVFSVAVQGMQGAASNQVIGELWATFEVELLKPKLLIGGGMLLTDHFTSVAGSTFNLANPFGTTANNLLLTSGSNIGCVLYPQTLGSIPAGSIEFPSFVVDGFYKVDYYLVCSVATANSPSYTALGQTVNIDVVSSAVNILGNKLVSYECIPPATSTCTGFHITQICKIIQTAPGTKPRLQLLFNAGLFPTGTQICDLMITQMSPTIN
uniref:Capsid protein n=1 Tax=Cruciviridae sp. TaxID=1955495 RepID=A0A1S6LVG3_9VIRU|nr:capsid protein [Cruciviridae sp.]